jgi:hypothetical protein
MTNSSESKNVKIDWEKTAEYYYEKWKSKKYALELITLIVLLIMLISFNLQILNMT